MEQDSLKWYKFSQVLLFVIIAFMGLIMHLMMERMDELNQYKIPPPYGHMTTVV